MICLAVDLFGFILFGTLCASCSWISGSFFRFRKFSAIISREGNGTPLQYSCLENPMDRGAWRAAVHGVARSRTRLSDFTFTFHSHAYWRRKWQPTPVFLPGESQGRGSLVGRRPWGRTESDTTEATYTGVYMSLRTVVFSGYMPSSGISGSYGSYIPSF